ERADQKQRNNSAPLIRGKPRFWNSCSLVAGVLVARQQMLTAEVDAKADEHADAGGAKAVMPAPYGCERAEHERRQERPDIDPEVKDRVGAAAASVAGCVERADLGRNVRLEGADTKDQHQQRKEKQRLRR